MNSSNKKFGVFEMIIDNQFDTNNTVIEASKSKQGVLDEWQENHQEGQLAIDVIETEKEVIVISTMAGADTSKIEVYVHSDDLLTIKGVRQAPTIETPISEFVYQECFWGSFSRTVVLPVHVYGDSAQATYKNGILILKIPKKIKKSFVPIEIIEE